MIHAEAVERAARALARKYAGVEDAWPSYKGNVDEVLVASGYPAALTDATAFLPDVLDQLSAVEGQRDQEFASGDDPLEHGPNADGNGCVYCGEAWPCPVERARVWLADHEATT